MLQYLHGSMNLFLSHKLFCNKYAIILSATVGISTNTHTTTGEDKMDSRTV